MSDSREKDEPNLSSPKAPQEEAGKLPLGEEDKAIELPIEEGDFDAQTR